MSIKSIFLTAAVFAATMVSVAETRIVVLSDIHVTPGNVNEQKLNEAVAEINAMPGVDMVVVDGDLTNEGSDEQLTNVKSILDKIQRPLYVLPGNHENNWSQSATKTFIDLWGNDRFVAEKDDLVIVGLNCGPFMKMGDGHIKQEDLHWLKSTLDQRVKPGMKVVSFNHYPLRKDDLDNYADYIRILEKYPTIIHINGHYHKYEPYQAGDIEAMMVAALDQRDGKYGYSVVEIGDDKIDFFRKLIGSDRELLHTAPVRTSLKPFAEDETVSLIQPDGYQIEKVWTDSASIFTRLSFDGDNVYFGNSLGYAKAVDKRSGKLKWSAPTGASLFSRLSPAGDKIFVPGGVHKMIILDRDGNQIKSIDSKGCYAADGIIADGALYQGGYKKFEKWNAVTGDLVWRNDSLNNYCQASAVVDGDDVIFGAWDTYLRCLDKNTGELRWKWNNGKSANMLGPGNVVPVVTADRVIIVAPDRYMTAVDRKTGETLWRDNSHRYRESLGVSADKTTAYAKTMDGELVAIDITAPGFAERWTVDMGLGYDHAPCIVAEKDGVVYAGSRRGIVTAVDPVGRKVLWSANLGVSEINGIDIDQTSGDVYVSLIEGTVYRIRKEK